MSRISSLRSRTCSRPPPRWCGSASGKLVVEDHHRGLEHLHQPDQLLELALAEVGGPAVGPGAGAAPPPPSPRRRTRARSSARGSDPAASPRAGPSRAPPVPRRPQRVTETLFQRMTFRSSGTVDRPPSLARAGPLPCGHPMNEPRQPACVLAIESSCDETAAAVVRDGRRVASNVIASQHNSTRSTAAWPEIASRAPGADRTDRGSGPARGRDRPRGPGCGGRKGPARPHRVPAGRGELREGPARSRGLPFLGVDHESHLLAGLIDRPEVAWPAVGLVVNGGHTCLYELSGPLTSGCWARPSTTRPARRSTRPRPCSGCPTREARSSTGWPRTRGRAGGRTPDLPDAAGPGLLLQRGEDRDALRDPRHPRREGGRTVFERSGRTSRPSGERCSRRASATRWSRPWSARPPWPGDHRGAHPPRGRGVVANRRSAANSRRGGGPGARTEDPDGVLHGQRGDARGAATSARCAAARLHGDHREPDHEEDADHGLPTPPRSGSIYHDGAHRLPEAAFMAAR